MAELFRNHGGSLQKALDLVELARIVVRMPSNFRLTHQKQSLWQGVAIVSCSRMAFGQVNTLINFTQDAVTPLGMERTVGSKGFRFGGFSFSSPFDESS